MRKEENFNITQKVDHVHRFLFPASISKYGKREIVKSPQMHFVGKKDQQNHL